MKNFFLVVTDAPRQGITRQIHMHTQSTNTNIIASCRSLLSVSGSCYGTETADAALNAAVISGDCAPDEDNAPNAGHSRIWINTFVPPIAFHPLHCELRCHCEGKLLKYWQTVLTWEKFIYTPRRPDIRAFICAIYENCKNSSADCTVIKRQSSS